MVSWNESDIEDYFYEHPKEVKCSFYQIDHWVARQYHVPSGIVDLIGAIRLPRGYSPVVVELKNRPVKSEDLAQIMRYSHDLEKILSRDVYQYPTPAKLIIAPGEIQNNVLHEAMALDIEVRPFDVSISVNLHNSWSWNKDYKKKIDQQIHDASHDATFFDFSIDFDEEDGSLKPFEDYLSGKDGEDK